MFNVLLESRATRPRRPRSTIASAVMHGAIIAAAAMLTRPHPGAAVDGPKPRTITYVPVRGSTRPNRPTDQRSVGGVANAGRRAVAAPSFTSTQLPPVDLVLPGPQSSDLPAAPSDDIIAVHGVGGSGLGQPDGVIDEHFVDRVPRVIGGAPEPRYPTVLREAGIQGRVLAEFVVDTLGRAELEGLELDSPQALFAEAVRAVLPRYRFTPGEAGGGKVRTRVQLPFDFALTR